MTLNKFNPKRQLEEFLAEDIGRRDITSSLLTQRDITAHIITREPAVIAGTIHAKTIFGMYDIHTKIQIRDGSKAKQCQRIMTMKGDATKILMCERTVLNILARMSGIATQTANLVSKVPKRVDIYATRKTAPGLRYFDKEAVEIGGGNRHRMRLDEMVLIKDNHIAVEGSMISLIQRAKKRYKLFEVEVDTIRAAVLAAENGAERILLDNFTPIRIRATINALKRIGLRRKVRLEASGGITDKNITKYADTGVDMISVGSITNSVHSIDMSLEI